MGKLSSDFTGFRQIKSRLTFRRKEEIDEMKTLLAQEKQLREEAEAKVRTVKKEMEMDEKKTQEADSKEVSDLQQATLILGVEGVFYLPDGKLMYGSGGDQNYIREHFRNIDEGKLDFKDNKKDKKNFKRFKDALDADEKENIGERIKSGKSVIVETGWKVHYIGMYALAGKDKKGKKVIKLVVCNRGDDYDSLQRPENERKSGNAVYFAPYSEKAIQLIDDLKTHGEKAQDSEQFYKYFYKHLQKEGYVLKGFQELRPLKMGNCIVGDQKALMAAVLSKDLYKQITTNMRKDRIDFLTKKMKGSNNLDECVEFKVLNSYLQQNMASALYHQKKYKLSIIDHAMSKLAEVKEVFENKKKRKTIKPEENSNLEAQIKKFDNLILQYHNIKELVNLSVRDEKKKQPASVSSIGIFAEKSEPSGVADIKEKPKIIPSKL